jgi:hypothetical protein
MGPGNGGQDAGSGLAISLTEQLVCVRDKCSARLKRRYVSGAHGLRGGRDLAFGLMAGSLALDADQQLLIEHRQDAVEYWDRGDVLAAFQLGDERMRGDSSPGDLLLGEIQLVAPLADVGGDPVLLAQRPDNCVLLPRLPVPLAAPGRGPWPLGLRSCPAGWYR